MAKSRSFSIYLLKQGFEANNSLKDEHMLESDTQATHIPDGSSLYISDNRPRNPWWTNYFGVNKQLEQVTKGALLFLPCKDRVFALTFGHVAHNLKHECYEYDFGLRVTLNSLDPKKLKSTDTLEPGAARRRRTQLPIEADLAFFGFDSDSDILKNLTGIVGPENEELFKHATGSSHLRVSSSLGPDELERLCSKLLESYESEAYRETFPDVQNVVPIRDPMEIRCLDGKLIEALTNHNDNLYLAIPAIVDFSESIHVKFSGEGKSKLYDQVFLDHYREYLTNRKKEIATISIDDLNRHRLVLTKDDGNKTNEHPIRKCLIFDTQLDGESETFHLNDGEWYKIDSNYMEKLSTYLNPLCKELDLPECVGKKEPDYNADVANHKPNLLCLDGTNIAPKGQSQVEPCDLLDIGHSEAVFYHIKVSTLSAKLSHLFNQGASAVELLKSSEEASSKLRDLVATRDGEEHLERLKKLITEHRYKIIYGIISHKDRSNLSKNLPLFSRIALMRTIKHLKRMGVVANYGFIPNTAASESDPKPNPPIG